jgi:phosphopantetheine--protein transferase-like protein
MGIGTDIVCIIRFEKLITNNAFMNKNFLPSELEYIKSKNNNLATIAGIYASKEAFLKAIKMGINNYQLKDIEICHDNNNAPYISLHNELGNNIDNDSIAISISHDGDYAIATVIVNYSYNI